MTTSKSSKSSAKASKPSRPSLTDIPFAISRPAHLPDFNVSLAGHIAGSDSLPASFSTILSPAEIIDQSRLIALALEAGYDLPKRVSQKAWEDFVADATVVEACEFELRAEDIKEVKGSNNASAKEFQVSPEGDAITDAESGAVVAVVSDTDAVAVNAASVAADAAVNDFMAGDALERAMNGNGTILDAAAGPDINPFMAESIQSRFRSKDFKNLSALSSVGRNIAGALQLLNEVETTTTELPVHSAAMQYLKALAGTHTMLTQAMLKEVPGEHAIVTLMRKHFAESGPLNAGDYAELGLVLAFAQRKYDDLTDGVLPQFATSRHASRSVVAELSQCLDPIDDADAAHGPDTTGMRSLMNLVTTKDVKQFVTYDGGADAAAWKAELADAFTKAAEGSGSLLITGPQGFPIAAISATVASLWAEGRIARNGCNTFASLEPGRAVILETIRRRLEEPAGDPAEDFAILDFVWDVTDSAGRFVGTTISGAKHDVSEDLAEIWLEPHASPPSRAFRAVFGSEPNVKAREFAGAEALRDVVKDVALESARLSIIDPELSQHVVMVHPEAAELLAESGTGAVWTEWLTAAVTNALNAWERSGRPADWVAAEIERSGQRLVKKGGLRHAADAADTNVANVVAGTSGISAVGAAEEDVRRRMADFDREMERTLQAMNEAREQAVKAFEKNDDAPDNVIDDNGKDGKDGNNDKGDNS